MSNWIPTVALIAAFVLAVTAFVAFSRGRYMLAGTSFLALSVALYVRETQK
ncbi:hypothetical protein [Natronococcus pandeyae]|uniref:hypothetical protein n=1 Tax=Natronococcus pandeyae TaxID=2055836 RepID=UPI001652E4B2|nr:hypothetical protein [Natronococcus pandeyae]